MADRPSHKRRIIIIGVASTVIFVLSTFITISFFDKGIPEVLRNYFIAVAIFLILYSLWIRVFENYERIYKLGL